MKNIRLKWDYSDPYEGVLINSKGDTFSFSTDCELQDFLHSELRAGDNQFLMYMYMCVLVQISVWGGAYEAGQLHGKTDAAAELNADYVLLDMIKGSFDFGEWELTINKK